MRIEHDFWHAVNGLFVAVAILTALYVAIRFQAVQATATAVVELQIEQRELHATLRADIEDVEIRLVQIEKLLYGDVATKSAKNAKPPPPRSVVLEEWFQNQAKDLRARVERLERWRLETAR
ncbi:MAG TPA: hypothetical protein VFN64_09615 [Burkholderiaceae bacterium]|nr:hypothetical protein [Burkholderiaceae bacterium]